MNEFKKLHPTTDRQRYENMTAAEIDAELQRFGIDPGPTIEAVTKLVRAKLEERRDRGRLHEQKRRLDGWNRCVLHSAAGPPHAREHVHDWSCLFSPRPDGRRMHG